MEVATRRFHRHQEREGILHRVYYKNEQRVIVDESGGHYEIPAPRKHAAPYYVGGRKLKQYVNHGLTVRWE